MKSTIHTRSFQFVFITTVSGGCSPLPVDSTVGEEQPAVAQDPSMTRDFDSPTGRFSTFTATGTVDTTNPFFLSLGTNGRSCFSCHRPEDGWTITPAHVSQRFDATTPAGTDPIFRTNDGSNSPLADVSTPAARRAAYSMLLTKGLIRVGLPIPGNAEFELIAVDDPYGFASAAELSLFRRPLPSANLKFLSTVMWDGRETFRGQSVDFDLLDQSNGATLGHAQAAQPLTPDQRRAVVDLESTLFVAANFDADAHELTALKAQGGAATLAAQPFHLGINDVLGGDPAPGAPPFSPIVFNLYDTWAGAKGNGVDGARAAVARGQALFNGKPIAIVGVKGLNDDLAIPSIAGTCTTCHDSPNAGDHSLPAPLDIGLTTVARRTPDLPLYTLRNLATQETVQTTDPGRALITGRWKDIGRFKGPILRALSSRAPYFHNGSAASLDEVVAFYDARFAIGFTAAERADLVAFLRTL
jgi:hypothetical protein